MSKNTAKFSVGSSKKFGVAWNQTKERFDIRRIIFWRQTIYLLLIYRSTRTRARWRKQLPRSRRRGEGARRGGDGDGSARRRRRGGDGNGSAAVHGMVWNSAGQQRGENDEGTTCADVRLSKVNTVQYSCISIFSYLLWSPISNIIYFPVYVISLLISLTTI